MRARHVQMVGNPASHDYRRGLGHDRGFALFVILLGGLMLALAGCKGLITLQPPTALQVSASKVADAAANIEGVVSATAEVHDIEVRDSPEDWLAILRVKARSSDDLASVSIELRDLLDQAPEGFARFELQLTVPGDELRQKVLMRDVSDTMIEAAETVRAWPGVEVVDVGRSEGEIYVQMNGVSIADMVQLTRDQVIVDAGLATVVVFGWGDGGIKGYIAVSESLPSATLIDAMETLRALPDVESISYTSFALSDESALGQEFQLRVVTDDIEAVRLVLERTQIAPGDGSCHQYALTSDESYVRDEFGVCE